MTHETRSRWEEKNWAAFKERYGMDKFESAGNLERIEIMNSRVGLPTARVKSSDDKWVFLHSSVDPVKEAKKIADSVSTEPGKVIVVYGFALGYLVEALLETVDDRNPLCIIEPDRELFFAAMASRDLRHLILSARVNLILGDSAQKIQHSLFAIYDEAKYSEFVMTGLLGHQTVYSDVYYQSMKCIRDAVSTKLINLKTIITMGPDFVSNTLLNLADYCTHPGVSSLFNRLEGMPVIVVSAGPSLNKNIQLLKEAKGKAAILAVGTAVKALKKWKIEPDFIFSVHPEVTNYDRHFKGVDTGGAALVAEVQSCHMVLESYQGPIFVSGDMAMLKWFGDSIEDKGKIESGGSVANNALVAAYKMGGNPIILVGQDLAYARDGHSHAAGTSYETDVYSGGESLKYFYVKANDGGQLLTDRPFYQFLTFFQHWIKSNPEREYINATEGGAFIEGTKLMTLHEVLAQYCRKTVDVQGIIKEAQDSFKVPTMEPILEKLELRLKDTKKTIADANKAIKHLIALEKACTNRQAKKMQQHLKAVGKIYEKFEKEQHIREAAEWFAKRELHSVFTRTHEAEYLANDNFSNAIDDYSLYYKTIIEGSKSVEDLLYRCIENVRGKMYNG